MIFFKVPMKCLPLDAEGIRKRAPLSDYLPGSWRPYQWRAETGSEDTQGQHSIVHTCIAATGRLEAPLTLYLPALITGGLWVETKGTPLLQTAPIPMLYRIILNLYHILATSTIHLC